MCLIVVAGQGQQKYSDFLLKSLRTGAITNDDGIGYAYKKHKNNTIYISKGFKDIEKVIKSIKSKRLGLKDELIVHLRIGNRGAVNTDMCHPFVLAEDDEDILSNKKFVEYPIMAHNGTFTDYNNCAVYSDTYQFIQEFMYHPAVIDMLIDDPDFFKKVFKEKLKTNRLAFLFPYDGVDLITLGEYKEQNGYLFSNDSFKDKTIRNVGGWEEDDDWWNKRWAAGARAEDCRGQAWRNQLHTESSLREFALSAIRQDDDGGDDDLFSQKDVVFPMKPQKIDSSLTDKAGIEIGLPVSTKDTTNSKVGTVTRSRFGYRKADHSEINVSEFSIGDTFKNQYGVKFIEYMGFYIPVEFNSDTQYQSMQVKPTVFNYNDLMLECIIADADYPVLKRGVFYIIEEFDNNYLVISKKYLAEGEKAEFLTIPMYLLNVLFCITPHGKVQQTYKEYYNLLRYSVPTIQLARDANNMMGTKRFTRLEKVIFNKQIVGRRTLELLKYNLIEHCLSKANMKKTFHRNLII